MLYFELVNMRGSLARTHLLMAETVKLEKSTSSGVSVLLYHTVVVNFANYLSRDMYCVFIICLQA